jgi:hypothetical protein
MDKYNRMLEEVRDLLKGGDSIEDIRDRATEYVDSWLPVYHSDILNEWRDMPTEYNDRGSEEFGTTGGIFSQMTNDLFLYYLDEYYQAIDEVEEEEKEKEESEEE